jgi:tetratricopeptide (TPR) repeat protein
MTEHQETTAHAAEHHDILHLKKLIETYGVRVSTLTLVLLVAITAFIVIRKRAEAKITEASIRLARAQTLADLETLGADYASTPIAPFALLKEAKAHFTSGNYNMARNKYREFEERFPGHDFILFAELGKLHCMEAVAQLEDALSGYDAFASANPDHYLTPQAIFGKGRCLEQLGRMEDARVVYEDFVNDNEESPWIGNAEEMLQRVTAKIARGETTASIATPNVGQIPSFLAMPQTSLDTVPVLAGPEPVATNAIP